MEKQGSSSGVNAMTFRGLFRIKVLDSILKDADEPERKLYRALCPVSLTLFGIGTIIFGVPIIFNLLAVGILAVITLVLIWGVRESAAPGQTLMPALSRLVC